MSETTLEHGIMCCVVCDSDAGIAFPFRNVGDQIVIDMNDKARCLGCEREKAVGGWIYLKPRPRATDELDGGLDEHEEDAPKSLPPGIPEGARYVSSTSLERACRQLKEEGVDIMYVGVDDVQEMEAVRNRNTELTALRSLLRSAGST